MLKKAFVMFFILIAVIVVGITGFAGESQTQYTVGVDDVLSISVSGHDDLKTNAPVASDGTISFPYIGSVCVKGMSLSDIERVISQKLADGYIKYPVVSVTLSTSKSLKYFVYGEVKSPGRYLLEDDLTVLKTLSAAGGITPDGLYGDIKIRRKQKDKQEYEEIIITLNDAVKADGAKGDMPVQAEDIVIVGHNKSFFVYGAVTKPGKFVLEDNMTALKAISLAEGFTKYGSPDRVKILRKVMGKADYESIKVDIKGAISGHVGKDVFLAPDDIVVASEGML